MTAMILVHPPVAKACEPPAGITKLAGFLEANGVNCTLIDANLEGMFHILRSPVEAHDTWTKRAARNCVRNLKALHEWSIYKNLDRYSRAVMDLNRIIATHGLKTGAQLSLSDYRHKNLSPLKSDDLLWSAEHPEADPYHSFFSGRLPGIAEADTDGVVGFSLNYLSQALTAFSMIGYMRRELPGLRLVLGGGLVTSWCRRQDLRNKLAGLVDDVVSGPGEYTLLRILGKNLTVSGETAPQFSGLRTGEYLSPGLILPYAASSGCYWGRCSFCPEQAEGAGYHPVAPELAVTHLRRLEAASKPALFHLADNAVSPAFMESIIRERSARGASAAGEKSGVTPWYGFARITPHLSDPDFCAALAASGCVMLKLGVESADQDVLDSMRKGHDIETARLVLAALKGAGISTYVYLIFGTPQERETSARATLGFVTQESGHIDFLNLALFNLPIGSAEADLLETRPFFGGDLSLYTDFVHPLGWDRRRVRQFVEREFSRHPAVQKILRKQPPFFTSNHAPLFAVKERCT